ncbi:MAG: hypothetical protein JWO22_2898 [Frankiales bacterium]|nr:hypothetical protein [Frankiales bacterium]
MDIGACGAGVCPDGRRVELTIHDASWRGLLALRDAVAHGTRDPHTTVCVDLHEIAWETASTFWLAAIVSAARVARARGCGLEVRSAPAHLCDALARLGLGARQFEPGVLTGGLGTAWCPLGTARCCALGSQAALDGAGQ